MEDTAQTVEAEESKPEELVDDRTAIDPVAVLMNLQEKARNDRVLAAQIEAATWQAAYQSERQR